ncbi:MAG TPA: hypothetical protein VHR66_27800 [Gemmataceae bacterium]|jgi:hypothetical protein|nr:hypothetical protein [Gemmataceae bacterium]
MPTTLGFGAAARSIELKTNQQRSALRQSTALGNQPALDELIAVAQECHEPNWDGYGARAVTPRALSDAFRFLQSLPYGFPLPSVGAEPDGHVTLEWYSSVRRSLSVSIDPDGYLHFAALMGTNHLYGTFTFFETAPRELLRLIREVCG